MRHGRDEFEFINRARLSVISNAARMWLPLAASDPWQQVHLLRFLAPTSWKALTDRRNGNQVSFLELDREAGGATIEIAYHVGRLEKGPHAAVAPEPNDLFPDIMVPSSPHFLQRAAEATQGRTTEIQKARALYDHVIEQFRYAKAGAGWGLGDATRACSSHSGNGSDFHSNFIALTRAIGIPARFAIGAAIPSKRDEGGTDGDHCWAEFFADGKWWPADISEAEKNTGLATCYLGHHPANRFELSRGRDLTVEPRPVSGPINFLAYAVLEVDGKPTAAKTDFRFIRSKAQKCHTAQ